MSADYERFLTVSEAAEMMSLATGTVRNHCLAGNLEYCKSPITGTVKIPLSAVHKFLGYDPKPEPVQERQPSYMTLDRVNKFLKTLDPLKARKQA